MKKSLLVLLIHIFGGVLFASGYELSCGEALQTVAAYRALDVDGARYYFALTDTVINDSDCIIDSMPSGVSWLVDNTPKWLIFVDEQPDNHSWSHPCKYYYVPQIVADHNSIPIHCFEGNFMPKISNLNPADSLIDEEPDALFLNHPFVSHPDLSTLSSGSNLHVAIIGGGRMPANNYESFYNNTKHLYNVLTRRYSVPKENVHVLLGSGGTIQNDVVNKRTMPLDLDDDGLRDILGPFANGSVDSLFSNLALELDESSYLMVFVDAHGQKGTGDIAFFGDGFLTKERLRQYLDSIHVAAQFVFINSCYSGHHIYTLMNADNRIVVTSCGSNQYSYSGIYSYFLHCFTNALHGVDCNQNAIYADADCNGFISFEEAFQSATNYRSLYNSEHAPDDDVREYENGITPQFFSKSQRIGKDFAINHLPDPIGLYIRDTDNDDGMDRNVESPKNLWKSPDIWVRNNNDGMTNVHSEPLQVSSADNKVYIYTRVHNRGWKSYDGQGRYLHLHWAPTALRHAPSDWVNTFPTVTYPELGIIPLTELIDTLSSCIVAYEWNVPQHVVSQVSQNNGYLNIDILARISDSPYTVMDELSGNRYPFKYSSAGSIYKESTLAALSLIKNDSINQSIEIPLSFFVTADEADSVCIGVNDFMPQHFPAGTSFRLELSPSLAWAYCGDSTANHVIIDYSNPICVFKGLTPGNYSITAHLDINSNDVEQSEQFTISFSLASAQNHLGGVVFEASIGPRSNTISPEIGDDEGGSSPGDDSGEGGEEGLNGSGIRLLSLSGVDEPVTCQWVDSSGLILSTEPSLALPLYCSGEYTLKVKAVSDGAQAKVTKTILPVYKIDEVYYSNETMQVILSHPSFGNQHLQLRQFTGNDQIIIRPVDYGKKNIIFNHRLPPGLYILSLIHDGHLVDSKRFIIH